MSADSCICESEKIDKQFEITEHVLRCSSCQTPIPEWIRRHFDSPDTDHLLLRDPCTLKSLSHPILFSHHFESQSDDLWMSRIENLSEESKEMRGTSFSLKPHQYTPSILLEEGKLLNESSLTFHIHFYTKFSSNFRDFSLSPIGSNTLLYSLRHELTIFLLSPSNLPSFFKWKSLKESQSLFLGDMTIGKVYKFVLKPRKILVIPSGWIYASLSESSNTKTTLLTCFFYSAINLCQECELMEKSSDNSFQWLIWKAVIKFVLPELKGRNKRKVAPTNEVSLKENTRLLRTLENWEKKNKVGDNEGHYNKVAILCELQNEILISKNLFESKRRSAFLPKKKRPFIIETETKINDEEQEEDDDTPLKTRFKKKIYDLTNQDSVRQLLSHKSSKTKFHDLNEALSDVLSDFGTEIPNKNKKNKKNKETNDSGSLTLKLMVKGPLEETLDSSVYQDEDFIYPSLTGSGDDEYEDSSSFSKDRAWSPKSKVKTLLQRVRGPSRKSAKVTAVERGLAAAAANLLPSSSEIPKRKESGTNDISVKNSSSTTTTINETPVTHKRRKGFCTPKQRLGKLLKLKF